MKENVCETCNGDGEIATEAFHPHTGDFATVGSSCPECCLPNDKCPMCQTPLTLENVNRWEADHPNKPNFIRLDGFGRAWCNPCTEKHDSIDWEEVYNR